MGGRGRIDRARRRLPCTGTGIFGPAGAGCNGFLRTGRCVLRERPARRCPRTFLHITAGPQPRPGGSPGCARARGPQKWRGRGASRPPRPPFGRCDSGSLRLTHPGARDAGAHRRGPLRPGGRGLNPSRSHPRETAYAQARRPGAARTRPRRAPPAGGRCGGRSPPPPFFAQSGSPQVAPSAGRSTSRVVAPAILSSRVNRSLIASLPSQRAAWSAK